jgi:hypothetical protein
VVLGVLVKPGTDEPMSDQIVYLGGIVYSDKQKMPFVSLDQSASPRTATDDVGRFVFEDVPPGKYGLIVWTPVSSDLVSDPRTGETLILDVRAGDTIDVGAVGSLLGGF